MYEQYMLYKSKWTKISIFEQATILVNLYAIVIR